MTPSEDEVRGRAVDRAAVAAERMFTALLNEFAQDVMQGDDNPRRYAEKLVEMFRRAEASGEVVEPKEAWIDGFLHGQAHEPVHPSEIEGIYQDEMARRRADRHPSTGERDSLDVE